MNINARAHHSGDRAYLAA